MKLITTEKQRLMQHIPTRLELLRELNKRKAFVHHSDLRDELLRQERGAAGEEILFDYIRGIAPDHWIVLKNVWIKYYGIFECDVLLITHAGFYIFEVKNYSGRFEVDQHVGKHGSKNVGNNVISQALKITINLREILHKQMSSLDVIGTAAFVGINNKVVIKDEINSLNILNPNEVQEFIWDIRTAEYDYRGYQIDSDLILDILSQYEISNPYPPEKDIPEEVFQSIREGVCCGRCGNFEIDASKKYLDCDCGMIEPRQEAILRTICEYGVLNYRKDLKTTELTNFFNDEVGRSSLLQYLKEHFERIGNNRSAGFINKGRPLFEVYNYFNLTEEKYIRFSGPIII